MYVISPPLGDLYACTRGCVADVLAIVIPSSGIPPVRTIDPDPDLDVFCSGCGVALGSRRQASRLIDDGLNDQALAYYRELESKVPRC